MDTNFYIAISASIFAMLTTTCGIYVIRHFTNWGRKQLTYFTCFAAGILIAASFLHIIPKSFAMNTSAPIFLLAGYLFMHFFNKFITAYVCNKPTSKEYSIGLIPMFGIGFHSFIDGIIYSITFSVGTITGILASTGMVLHEFPEGVVTYLLLIRSGFSKRLSVILAFLAAALTTPLGTLISYPFINHLSQSFLGILLALSAGCLVYVGATHLLPRAEEEPKRYSLIAFTIGILVAIFIVISKP